ncbi:PDC sensor domain-containing protein [Shewanella sedimentimangrovi]|uniref:Cache domain-containing protein n=1 Tax=Shewanella sedimentimangrovi TaxID=2814293 RepID=A0ABX7QZL9_9GAMM|nr:cache domain-containing protein [Shewanella sedimentimangrovi]QSX36415.1 cache domain-containing protein [Shewanella sedimentimangrovi]
MTSKRIVLVFLALLLPFSLLIGYWLHLLAEDRFDKDFRHLRQQQSLGIRLGNEALKEDFEALFRDVAYLAALAPIHDALNDDAEAAREQLAKQLAEFVAHKPIYSQLRLLDASGMERVRVNLTDTGISITPQPQLQNKADRYYVQETLRLAPGHIYVSPIDLNMERGKVSTPFEPMVRLSTPIFAGDQLKGMLILNYRAALLLQYFRDATREVPGEVMLLNTDGFWIVAPDPDKEWGFMRNRSDLTLAQSQPDIWSRIRNTNKGQVSLTSGLWTWESQFLIYSDFAANLHAPAGQTPMIFDQNIWKTVTLVPKTQLDNIKQESRTQLFRLGLVLLLAWSGLALAFCHSKWQKA